MYTHVVFFYLHSREKLGAVTELLLSLTDKVPSLQQIEVGADDEPSPRSADLCLITRFADRAGYEAYRDHPEHVAVVEQIKPLVMASKKVDWSA